MSYEEDYEKWQSVVEELDKLRDDDEHPWSDKKIARFLREEARNIDPPKPKRKTINVWKVSDEELATYSKEAQDKVKSMRERDLKALEELKKLRKEFLK